MASVIRLLAYYILERDLRAKPNLSETQNFLITPVLATLTFGVTQLNWGLELGLLLSKNDMLTKACSLKDREGKGQIGLFQFSEYKIKDDCSLFTLTTPSEGVHTGFYHSAKPREEEDILKAVVSGREAESYTISMGENWTYCHIKYKYTDF